jgi:hypothetical protein
MMPINEEEVNIWKEVTMKFALKPRKATTNANKNNGYRVEIQMSLNKSRGNILCLCRESNPGGPVCS